MGNASVGIEVRNVVKHFDNFAALDGVSLSVAPGELVALLGPSGSGKTTLLRVIAGLEFPDSGDVLFGGRDALSMTARERRVGFVFQQYALFRHMTVAQNVAFGLDVRPRGARPARAEITERVRLLLERVHLQGLEKRYPQQLSGGQRQRVALARALAIDPSVLLLDEPFGALDAKVRKELRRWLRNLHDELGLATLFVTHDQEEALELADRVVVLNKGLIEQDGSPQKVYDSPATAFVAQFIGDTLTLPVQVTDGQAEVLGARFPAAPGTPEGRAVAYIRPHDVSVQPQGTANGVTAEVISITLSGAVLTLRLGIRGLGELDAIVSRQDVQRFDHEKGSIVTVAATQAYIFSD
ncbi:sulfate ABC transporter ATP-binding protein [Oceanibaculum pacificum]|uniref:Sulfate ABC transporter ATP-binding protein n=1 Tax=Oceanibaculum pacificum TaxID=580166 RepID=A0A154W1B5_9PROT|nr:sulfate ABC transporter ATP-binding protein [Oceanibaculum pacificum]